ncbi:hypothetical protein GHT09_005958 [Marmota monax]|uniref:Uncharacterized protein n=1 Tax=Marmota monax TaxID=9995 RepID=A0A834V5I5_MARMO|nr:hypothetical protein GHT09_005958 [Marmota monax]
MEFRGLKPYHQEVSSTDDRTIPEELQESPPEPPLYPCSPHHLIPLNCGSHGVPCSPVPLKEGTMSSPNTLILFLCLFSVLCWAWSSPPPPTMYKFTLQERYSEHGMQKVRTVDEKTCFIHNCTSVSLILSPSRSFIPGSWNWPFICFLFDQTKDYCHWWPEVYNGCPYWSCRLHDERGSYSYHSLGYPEGWTSSYLRWHEGSLSDNSGWYTLDISDPKAKHWDYVEFAVYARTTSAKPTGWMTVSRSLITPPKAAFQVVQHIKESESY